MNTKLSARHFELTPEIKNLAEQNFDTLQRFYDHIIACHLTLDVAKHRKLAELQIKVFGQTLKSTGETDDMYASIEAAFDKAREQLKRYKGKLKDKKPKEINLAQADATKPETDADSVDY